jgi:hypothetical protein
MIISASRRTDIPAFYSEDFGDILTRGSIRLNNPRYDPLPLTPQAIDCFVFWTKNAYAFVGQLDRVANLQIPFYIQYTITSYGQDLEPYIPRKTGIVANFKELATIYGKERVIWRYDPILITTRYTTAYHREWFSYLAQELAHYTNKCVISFIDTYSANLERCIVYGVKTPTKDEVLELAGYFVTICAQHGLVLASCCETIRAHFPTIMDNACIDPILINTLRGSHTAYGLDSLRDTCLCVKSIDIGQYNTCKGGCIYCYARRSAR